MYSDKIIAHFTAPRNVGSLDDFDVEFELGNPACDDRVQVQLKLSKDGKTVEDIRYKAYGCATSLATASIFSSCIKEKSLDEIRGFREKYPELLGELEPKQMHCLDILKELFDKTLNLNQHVL